MPNFGHWRTAFYGPVCWQEDTDKQLNFGGCLLQEADAFLASLERLEQMDQLVLGSSQKFDL